MSTPDETTTTCPQCGSSVPAGAGFCGACGAQQPAPAAPAEPSPPDPAPVTAAPASEPFADVPVAPWPGTEPQPLHSEPAPSLPQVERRPALQGSPAEAPWPEEKVARSATPPPAAQTPQAPPGRVAPPPVAGTVPSAGDFADQLTAQLRTPGPSSAGIAAGIASVAALILGVVLVVGFGKTSLIGYTDNLVAASGSAKGVGAVSRVLLATTQALGVPLYFGGDGSDFANQSIPLLTTALVVLIVAFAVRSQAGRVGALRPVARLGWGAATAIPFGVIMAIIAVVGKSDLEGTSVATPVGKVLGLALVWGSLGGLAGAWWALSREERAGLTPHRFAPARGAVFVILRTLLVALGLTTAVMTAVVVVQTVRKSGDVIGANSFQEGRSEPRSVPQAALENGLYAVEHGIHGVDLAVLAQFRRPLAGEDGYPLSFPTHAFNDESFGDGYASVPGEGGSLNLPVPVTKASKVLAKDRYRLTSYSDALPSWVFAAGLIFLVGGAALLAVYAGFAAARIAAARGSMTHGGVWGALTGPLWAIVMVALSALATKTPDYPLFGLTEGASVFGMVLLFGAVGGAIGGTLGHDASRRATPVPVAPAPPSPFGPPPA